MIDLESFRLKLSNTVQEQYTCVTLNSLILKSNKKLKNGDLNGSLFLFFRIILKDLAKFALPIEIVMKITM